MKKGSRVALVALAIILVILAFLQTPLMHRSRGKAWSSWTNIVAKANRLGDLNSNQTVIDQNLSLRADNTRLQAELRDYGRLRQQLGSPSFDQLRPISAAVVSRPIDTFRSQLILNKGLVDGLELDAPVVINNSILVGFVTETNDHTAIMTSLYGPHTQLTVEIMNPDIGALPTRGLLQSQHYTSLTIKTIPRDAALQPGQNVVTVAKDRAVPPGLVVGNIDTVSSPEHEAYQSAGLKVPYDLDLIDAVNVLVVP